MVISAGCSRALWKSDGSRWWRLNPRRGLGRPAGGCEVQALEVKPRVISPRLHRSQRSPLPLTAEQLGRHQENHISAVDFPVDDNTRKRTVFELVSSSKNALQTLFDTLQGAIWKGYTLRFFQPAESEYGYKFTLNVSGFLSLLNLTHSPRLRARSSLPSNITSATSDRPDMGCYTSIKRESQPQFHGGFVLSVLLTVLKTK